jgi:hypothetical protein
MTTEGTVRRQPLLAVPGWLLFGCLFLPTLRVCGDPMIPLQFPPSYAVYLGGLVIALLAGARLLRSRRHAFSVVLTLWTVTLFSFPTLWVGAEMFSAGVATAVLLLGLLILLVRGMLRTAWSETAIAIGCFIHALIATGWSALLAFDPDAMWGAFVAVGAGLAMMLASGAMIARAVDEVARKRRETEPAPLPEARAIVRD